MSSGLFARLFYCVAKCRFHVFIVLPHAAVYTYGCLDLADHVHWSLHLPFIC